jgi:Ca2+:H+ antiporter
VLDKIRRRFLWLELICADGGYNTGQVEGVVAKVPLPRKEIVKRIDRMGGSLPLWHAPAGWVFVIGAGAIAVLADWLRRATEQLAERAGSTIGGLLNISFGNTAELILALFVLSRAQVRIVQAQITGSIIGTTLLFLGISALVGGVGRVRQTFNQASAGLLSTLLFLVVVAILLPAVFDLTERVAAPGMNTSLVDEQLSLGVSVVLLLLYAANLIYTLVTHRDLFAGDAPSGQAEWSIARALAAAKAGRLASGPAGGSWNRACATSAHAPVIMFASVRR